MSSGKCTSAKAVLALTFVDLQELVRQGLALLLHGKLKPLIPQICSMLHSRSAKVESHDNFQGNLM